MNSRFAHDLELLFWSVLFAAVGLAWMLYEARQFILRVTCGEVLPDPDKAAIVNQPPGEEVGEWHLHQHAMAP